MSDRFLLPLSIIIAGLLIGGGFYLKDRNFGDGPSSGLREQTSQDISKILKEIDANDHVLGSLKSRILVVEYSDPECPFCKDFHTSMLKIMQEYGKDEKVAWIYRHFPIAEIHSRALKEAEAQECAGKIGDSKFWEYTNKLYEVTPSDNNLDPTELPKIAIQIGLSSESFNACLESGQYAPRVKQDIENALELGALGTPYSILIDTKTGEHYPLDGAYPYLNLKQAIDLILQS